MYPKKSLILASLLTLLGVSAAGAETYQIDPSHSRLGFSIRHIFSQVEGQFNDFAGEIRYDPQAPEKSSVKATIQIASIDTGSEKRDGHLRSSDFFDAEKYGTMTFASTQVVVKGDNLLVTGNLTLHGVTKKVNFPVAVLGTGKHPMMGVPVAGFTAETTIKRSDFGVDSWTDAANVLGDNVAVRLNIEALGK